MANPWFKFYGGDYLSDPKILDLSAAERSCWTTLLAYASQSDGLIKHMSEHKLMTQAGVDFMKDEWQETVGVLEHFKELDMICLDDGMITVLNWNKRQEKTMTPYERTKKWRDKKKMMTDDDADDDTRIDKNREDKKREEIPFSDFWNIYPKKAEKKKSEAKWKKLPLEIQKKILSDLPIRKQTESWKKGYVLNPMTYLNGERWNDELVGVAAPPQKKICPDCKLEATSWVQVGNGFLCTDCSDKPRSKKYQDMKAKALINTNPR